MHKAGADSQLLLRSLSLAAKLTISYVTTWLSAKSETTTERTLSFIRLCIGICIPGLVAFEGSHVSMMAGLKTDSRYKYHSAGGSKACLFSVRDTFPPSFFP